MCEQLIALDISARNAAFKEKAPTDIIEEIVDIIYGFVKVKESE